MKRIFLHLTFLAILLSVNCKLFSQTPQSFNYQAVLRNSSGALITSGTVSIRVSIIQGPLPGTSVYTETHSPSPNPFGLVTLQIGKGTTTGSFSSIDWSTGNYFIKIELDPNGGSSYTDMGTTQLLSVPFAMYSANSGPTGILGQTMRHDGSKWIANSNLFNDGSRIGIGTTSPLGSAKFHVNSHNKYAGYFTSDSLANATQVLHAEYTGAAAEYDVIGVYSKSVVKDNRGIGGDFEGGYMGLYAHINSTSTTAGSDYFGIDAEAMGGVGNDFGVSAGAYGNGTNYGLYAYAYGGTTNYAGYFNYGNVVVKNNLGIGTDTPSSKLDVVGTININGGDTCELNRTKTGTANLVPIAYGSITSAGVINTAGSTSNFNCNNTAAGTYSIGINGEYYSSTGYVTVVTFNGTTIGFTRTSSTLGRLFIYTYNSSGTLTSNDFQFVIYKP